LKEDKLVGRDSDIQEVKYKLEQAFQGKGTTVFISGEAGIGKSTLANIAIDEAKKRNAHIFQGWCLSGGTNPMMPLKEAFRDTDIGYLISGRPPPLLVSTYLIDPSGLLIAKEEREMTDLDSDIFSSMIKAVENFVKDSLSMMGHDSQGGLNGISFGDFRILLKHWKGLILAAVIEGEKNEFLIDDLDRTLKKAHGLVEGWDGDVSKVQGAKELIKKLITSGKYEGYHLTDDPKLVQENLFDNVVLGIQRFAEQRPVVLFLDDLQWADPTTLSLFHYLSRNINDSHVLLLGTYRPEDLNSSEKEGSSLRDTLKGMNREGLYSEIGLNRLDLKESKALVDSTLDASELSEEFYTSIYGETTGNPLFIEELIQLLIDEEHMVREKGSWKLKRSLELTKIPDKIYDVIKRRLDKLEEEHYNILECASVMGVNFRSDILQEVLGLDRLSVLRKLSNLEKKHRLIHSEDGSYFFDHNEIREVIYRDILHELKVEYHRIIGERFEKKYLDGGEDLLVDTALHLYHGKDKRAIEYLVKSADEASAGYSNSEAIELYDQALDMMDKPDPGLLVKIGDLYLRTGNHGAALSAYGEALDSTQNYSKQADMIRNIGYTYNRKGDYDQAIERCKAGLSLVKETHSIIEGKLYKVMGWAHLRKGNYDKANEYMSKGLNIAKEADDRDEMGEMHHALGTLFYTTNVYEKSLDHFKRSLSIKQELGDEKGIAKTMNNMGNLLEAVGDIERSLEHYKKGLEIVEKIGEKYYIAATLNNMGIIYWETGKLDKVLECQKRSLEIFKTLGNQHYTSTLLNNVGNIYHDQGDLEKALDNYEEALSIANRLDEKSSMIHPLTNIGLAYIDMDELETARGYIEKSLQLCTESQELRQLIVNYFALGEIYLKEVEIEKASDLAKKALDIALQLGSTTQEGKSRTIYGMVHREKGEYERAKKEFIKAIELLDKSGEKRELARTYYEYALLLSLMGDEEGHTKYCKSAVGIWEKNGMALWIKKVS